MFRVYTDYHDMERHIGIYFQFRLIFWDKRIEGWMGELWVDLPEGAEYM